VIAERCRELELRDRALADRFSEAVIALVRRSRPGNLAD
jgi:hypothetical protein